MPSLWFRWLKNFFNLPDEYIAKTKYVRPGEFVPHALNVDTGFEATGVQSKWFTEDDLTALGMSLPAEAQSANSAQIVTLAGFIATRNFFFGGVVKLS